MGTVKSCLFNVFVPPSFDQRKTAETNYLHSYLSKQCNWYLCALSACRQAKLKYYFNYLDFLTGNVLFYDKILFSESSSLYTDCLFPKPVREKSLNPYECYLSRSKALQTRNIISSITIIFFHQFSTKYSLNNNILNFKKIVCVGSSCRGHP